MSLGFAFGICALIGVGTGVVSSAIIYFTYRDKL